MSDTAIVTQDEIALDSYGAREDVREMTTRLTAMLPSVKELGRSGAMALAQASLAMGLNPFIGEVWAIPQRGGTFAIMVGIKGLCRKAHQQAAADGGMYSVHIRTVDADEIEGLQINKGDIVRACDLFVSGTRATAHHALTGQVPRFTGIGVYRNGEKTQMNPLQVARKRAEAEAIKQAFDVPLSFVYGGGPDTAEIEIDALPERYTEHGDSLINGDAKEATEALFGEYIDAPVIVEPEPEGVESNGVHWIDKVTQDGTPIRTRFWAWAKNDLGLTEAQVYEALDVASIHDYEGSMAEAKSDIYQYIEHQIEVESTEPVPEVE